MNTEEGQVTQAGVLNGKIITPAVADLRKSLVVKDSPIQGRGLFTTVGIEAEQVILTFKGEIHTHKYHPSLSSQNPNWIGTAYEEWLELYPGDNAVYINHSCCPNVIIDGSLQLLAIADINPGEELLLDYSTTELDPYWTMKCLCKCKGCRKTLRSFQILPSSLQKKYYPYLGPAFKEVAAEK